VTAATRKTATVANGGSDVGTSFTVALDLEIETLWRYAVIPLTTVAGTNTVTAASDTTVVAAITAYAKGMKFSVIPANDNTGAVTINIDSVGAVAVKDSDGNALAAGSWKANRQYIIEHDGTNFRKVGDEPL
jgi:hypothetical protein